MSIFSFFGGGANINEGVAEARETSGAVLIDMPLGASFLLS